MLFKVVDPESGEVLARGEEGEVLCTGPNVLVGYLNNPTADETSFDKDGWFRTGDIGKFDSDGYMTLTDRLKELIKYKGFQVPPAELEGLLLTHPAIVDAAVIGIADDEAGELPKAFITLAPGAELSAEQVQEFVAGQVASYKKIRLVEFIDEIPKSASGKILRRELRDRD
jgi:acyl-CoA synthetase (AMP-forming)/AMP-acid ligase II